MGDPGKLRRAGYAPASVEVGRRGLHTRQSIVRSAARLFLAHGFHGTSIESIAKAAGGSRATVYQYFEDKEAIYRELAAQCAPAMLDHGARLGRLGPNVEGIRNLFDWLDQWADLYDKHAAVLLEFPGLGISGSVVPGSDHVSNRYSRMVTDRLREAQIEGMTPEDAATALLRVAHMVNLYRYRGMFGLPNAPTVTASLAVALQLLLFPETPRDVLSVVGSAAVPAAAKEPGRADEPDRRTPSSSIQSPPAVSPIRSDIAAAGSALFAAHGYHAVGMDDIASAASISRATLYRHFSTKVAILSELTQWAVVEGADLAGDLRRLAEAGCDLDSLHAWLGRYVHFHRHYAGVVRTWYDGGLSAKLADAVSMGIDPFQEAATALLARLGLPHGIDHRVGATVFLSVLGRLSELTVDRQTDETDYDTASLMLTVLIRAFGLSDASEPESAR